MDSYKDALLTLLNLKVSQGMPERIFLTIISDRSETCQPKGYPVISDQIGEIPLLFDPSDKPIYIAAIHPDVSDTTMTGRIVLGGGGDGARINLFKDSVVKIQPNYSFRLSGLDGATVFVVGSKVNIIPD